ncbi:hypothetical protein ACSTKR_23400, partial [Vibrio parahaemolyticus]
VTSITLTPVLCYYLLPKLAKTHAEAESGLVRRLKAANRRLLDWGFSRSRPILIAGAVVTGVSMLGAYSLPR